MTPAKQELKDLRLFADPFSASSFRHDESETWTAEFDRRGNRIALRRDNLGRIYSLADGSLLAGNFRSLLASKDFADLDYLSRAIKHSYLRSETNWMELPFSIDRGSRGAQSFEEIDRFLSEISSGGVVGLEGPAGAGKTHFIERLALTRADRLLRRLVDEPLVIPVASAGKILSAIDDRIDGSLAALRAKFNRVELPALMRQRLIALAIDGFDELSDSRGYDNSWSALRELIGEVGRESLIILSGRDSFIGIETLRKLIGASVELAGSKLHSVRLDFPSADEATQWIVDVSPFWIEYSSELRQRLDALIWLRRPFFVSQISQADPETFLNSGDEPIVALCDDIVCREVQKLGLPSDISEDAGKKIVYSILTEAARTMVDYEIDYVDAALLEVAVEVACEEHAPGNEDFQRALSARAKTLTLLEPAPSTGDPDNRTFPHEKIKAYFYSRHLIAEISENSMIPLGIRRTQLAISDLAALGALLSLETSSFVDELANKVSHLLSDQNVTSTAFSNLAAIGFVCASDLPAERPFALSGGTIMDALLNGKPSVQLRRVYINRLDVSDTDLELCDFEECEVGELVISPITKIGSSRPEVHSVILQSNKGGESAYLDKAQILEVLGRETDHSAGGDEFEIPDTLAILARMMLKSHWVRLSRDDKRGRRIVDRDDWDATRNILQESGFLEVKNIGAGGRPDEFVHLRNAEDFLNVNTASEDIQRIVKSLI